MYVYLLAIKTITFFLSLRPGGILQILQSDWFWARAVFCDLSWSCTLTRAESLAAYSFTGLFVVVNEQNRWFRTIFLLKLALLLALATQSEFCYSDKTAEGRIKQVSQETASTTGGSWCRFTSFITYAVCTAILLSCTVYSTFFLCL